MPWNETIVGIGDTVSVGGTLWTNLGNGPGHLFPPMNITLENDGTYTVVSAYPQTSSGRNFVLQGFGHSGWYAMTPTMNEADLPASVSLVGLSFSAVRALYTLDNGCKYASVNGEVVPPVYEPGEIVVSSQQRTICSASSFYIDVDIQSATSWPLSTIEARNEAEEVLQVITAQMGMNELGPFPYGTNVHVVVNNAADASFFWTSPPFDGVYVQSYTVRYALDVSEATSTVANGQRLFIISDNDSLGTWPVGSIIESGAVVVPPEDLTEDHIIYANVTDDWWVNTSGGPGQWAPLLTLDHVEGSTTYRFASMYPHINALYGRTIHIEGYTVADDWQEVYVGPEATLGIGEVVLSGLSPETQAFRYRYEQYTGCLEPPNTVFLLDIPIVLIQAQNPDTPGLNNMFRSYNMGPFETVRTLVGVAQTQSSPFEYKTVVSVGGDPYIATSNDAGRTWFVPTINWLGAPAVQYRVSHGLNKAVWTGGPSSVCLSINSGASFVQVNSPGETNIVGAIDIKRAVVGTADRLYWTDNSGQNWQESINTSGREWSIGTFAYNRIVHLGNGRVLASSGRSDGLPPFVLISNDYGKTFTHWAMSHAIPGQPNDALMFYSHNQGAFLFGRELWWTPDAGESWLKTQSYSGLTGTFASFAINERFLIGMSKSQTAPNDLNGYSLNGGHGWRRWTETASPSGAGGLPSQATGTWAWPKMRKPIYTP